MSCRSWSRSRRRGSCSCVERELQPAPRPERGRTVLFSGGVSKGVVAYHFRSKDELLTQVVADVYATAGAEIQDRVAAASSPAAALPGYVEANLAFIQAHPAQIRAVAEIALNLRGPGGGLQRTPGTRDVRPSSSSLHDRPGSGRRAFVGMLAADVALPLAVFYGLRAARVNQWLALVLGSVTPAVRLAGGKAYGRRHLTRPDAPAPRS